MIRHTKHEMPYVTAVLIDTFEEGTAMTRLHATIVVEKDSQKPIVIGAGAARLKEIGTEARVELEKLFPPKVYLELFVKVQPHWRNNHMLIAELDYRDRGAPKALKIGRAAYESKSSRSSRRRSRMRLLSSLMIAVARSRLVFWSSRTFSSTVSREIKR